MSKNTSRSKAKKERLAQMAEQKKKRDRIVWTVAVIAVVIVLAAVIILAINLLKKDESADKKDIIYSLMDETKYEDTEEITDLVRLNVSYTDEDGQRYTGDILVQLNADEAPITVANFQKLVDEGFYDDLTFHRIIEGFMIQGGCPYGTGAGGADEDIVGEFSANGIENNIAHVRGTISMAREGERYDSNGNIISTGHDTASSQFFIVHETSANNTLSLDGKYAAFGQVIFGMETVDGIATLDTDSNDKPVDPVTINSATFVKVK